MGLSMPILLPMPLPLLRDVKEAYGAPMQGYSTIPALTSWFQPPPHLVSFCNPPSVKLVFGIFLSRKNDQLPF